MERIRMLNTYQRVILLVLTVIAVLFAGIYLRATTQEGYEYMEEFFLLSYDDGNTVYSGEFYCMDCSFTVTPEKVVSFRCDDKFYGPYTATEDPSAIPMEYAGSANAVGMEVRNNDDLMFRGAVLTNPDSGLLLFDENGDLHGFDVIVTMSDGSQFDENGNPKDPLEPDLYTVLELMMGPELTTRGHWIVYILALLSSVFTAVSILFADELFRLSLIFTLRDWDRAEPSEFEIAGRYISWTIFPILILWIYFTGLR